MSGKNTLNNIITKGCAWILAATMFVTSLPPIQAEAKSTEVDYSSAKATVARAVHYANPRVSPYERIIDDATSNTYETINGKKAPSTWNNKVPYIGTDEKVFTDKSGHFHFVFSKESVDYSDYSAVILGVEPEAVDESGELFIPDTLDAFYMYTNYGDSIEYCAVNKLGEFLYYRDDNDGEYKPCLASNIATWSPGNRDVQLYYTVKNVTAGLGAYADESAFSAAEPDSAAGRARTCYVRYIGMQSAKPMKNEPGIWKVSEPTTVTDAGGDISINTQSSVFYNRSDIKSVTGGYNLVGIGDYAFFRCTYLESVSLAGELWAIGNGAFYNCASLSEVDTRNCNKLHIIGANAFWMCQSLSSFYVPSGVYAIGDEAFFQCTGLKSLDLNSSGRSSKPVLSTIGYKAFGSCYCLERLDFPATLTQKMPVHYLSGCRDLLSITANNYTFDLIDGDPYIDEAYGGTGSYSDTVEKTLCHGLGGVDECDIDEWFAYKKRVKYDSYFGIFAPRDSALYETAKTHNIHVSTDISDGQDNDNNGGSSTEETSNIYILCDESEVHENTFTVDGEGTIVSCTLDPHCHEITIPAKAGDIDITTIGEGAFADKCGLQKVYIGSNIEKIEDGAFRGSHNLHTVIFTKPNNYDLEIVDGAFDTQDFRGSVHSCTSDIAQDPNLTFVGAIDGDYAPFIYAMTKENNINVASQSKTYIKYFSGYPTFLEVSYNPAREDTGDESELIGYPTYKSLTDMKTAYVSSATEALAAYPYMTADDFEALKKVCAYWKNPTANPLDKNAEDYDDLKACSDSIYDIYVPEGVESIKNGLFSNINPDGEIVDQTLKGSGTIYDNQDPNEHMTITDPNAGDSRRGPNGANLDIRYLQYESVKSVEAYSLAGLTSLRQFEMNGGDKIQKYAFFGCSALEDVFISGTVSELGYRPFRDCSALEEIDFGTNKIPSIFTCDDKIIYRLKNTGTEANPVYVNDTVIECLETRGLDGDADITAEELADVSQIYAEAFMDCDHIESVDLSSAKTNVIPDYCFAGTDSLLSVTTSAKEFVIKTDAFLDSNIRSVIIPYAYTKFGNSQAFGQTVYGADPNAIEATRNAYNGLRYDYNDDTTALLDASKPLMNKYNPYLDKKDVTRNVVFYTSEDSEAAEYAADKPYITVSPTLETKYKVYFTDSKNPGVYYDVQYVADGECASVPDPAPQHDGVAFDGWYLNGTTKVDVGTYQIKGTTYFIGMYEGETCTVTFWVDDVIEEHGNVQKTFVEFDKQSVPYGGSAKTPSPAPQKDGYRFTGWDKSYTNVTKNLEVFAQFERLPETAKHHLVFYNYDDTILNEQYVADGADAAIPVTPVRSGYRFVGWKPSDLTDIKSDMDIYALFEKEESTTSHKVYFVDSKSADPKNFYNVQVVLDGRSATVPFPAPTHEGYVFDGWYLFGISKTDVAKYPVTEDLFFTAIYQGETHTVTFMTDVADSEGNITGREVYKIAGTPQVQNVPHGASASTPNPSPHLDGYVFTGWDKSYDHVIGNLTVNAKFEKIPASQTEYHHVVFYNYDDTIISEQYVADGKAARIPTSPTRDGYTFIGWKPYAYAKVTRDMDIYAFYEKDETFKHHVVFKDDAGQMISEQYVAHGEAAVIPVPPYKKGYRFVRWSETELDIITSDMEVTAIYEREQKSTYKVYFVDFKSTGEMRYRDIQEVKDKEYASAPEPAPFHKGYEFDGWYLNGTTKVNVSSFRISEDTHFIAGYKNAEYTVKFVVEEYDSAGVSQGVKDYDVQTVMYGKSAITPAISPARDGYIFKGWDREYSFVTSDLTVRAVFEKEQAEETRHRVVFYNFDDAIISEQYVVNNEAALTPAQPAREDYRFIGWIPSDYSKVTKDMSIYAAYEKVEIPEKHKVVFYGWDDEVISEQYVSDGASAQKPTDPAHPGYRFVGWIPSGFTNITSDTDIYALFEESPLEKLHVNFYDPDGKLISEQLVPYGEGAIEPTAPVKAGYDFVGWDPSDFSNVTSDMDIVARYEKKAGPVTIRKAFFVDNMSGSPGNYYEVQDVEEGKCAVTPVKSPEHAGYTFTGWTINGVKVNVEEVKISANTYFTAAYDRLRYTVSFYDTDGQTLISRQNIYYGDSGVLPYYPVKPGYTFDGWFSDPVEGRLLSTVDLVYVTSDASYYARYSPNEYAVILNPNAGNDQVTLSDHTIVVTYGSTYGKLPLPVRKGYEFTGWFTDAISGTRILETTEVNITKTQTLYAHWDPKAVLVTFDKNASDALLDINTKMVVYGESYGPLPMPKRIGYSFIGWYLDDEYRSPVISKSVVDIESAHILKAGWVSDAIMDDPDIPPDKVLSITLNVKRCSIAVGETVTVSAVVAPITADQNLVWSIDNDSAAALDSDGFSACVTGVSPGNVTLTARSADGTKKATCRINVYENRIRPSVKSNCVAVGKTLEFDAYIGKTKLTGDAVEWSVYSDDGAGEASISSNGTLTGISEGKVVVYATNTATGGVSNGVTIDVYVPVKKASCSVRKVIISKGSTYELKADITPNPQDAPHATGSKVGVDVASEIVWSLKDPKDSAYISLDKNGLVTALEPRKRSITVIGSYRPYGVKKVKTIKCSVVVENNILTKVTISDKDLSMNVGDRHTLTAQTTPTVPVVAGVTWKSSNPDIANVDILTGEVTALSPGKTVITAITNGGDKHGNHLTAKCNVTVGIKPESVVITYRKSAVNNEVIPLEIDKKAVLDATVYGVGNVKCNIQDVKWVSSDTAKVSVDSIGKVTANKAGEVIIYAFSATDESVVGSCVVRSYTPVTKIKLDKTKVTIGKDSASADSYDILFPFTTPDGALSEGAVITWSVSGKGAVLATAVDVDSLAAVSSTAGKKYILMNNIAEDAWKDPVGMTTGEGQALAIRGTVSGSVKITATITDLSGKTKKVTATIKVQ